MPANALALRVSDATGLRIGDVLAIKTVDLLRGNRVSVRESKTGKKRVVYIPRALYAAVSAQTGEIWAFEGRKGKYTHRTRQAVWADVKRARAAFRIPAHMTPHSARKLYAVRLMRRYGDLGKVQEKLNHSDVAVTMIYAFADVLTDRALNLRKNLQKCCCKETMMLLYLLKETESLLIMPFLRGDGGHFLIPFAYGEGRGGK